MYILKGLNFESKEHTESSRSVKVYFIGGRTLFPVFLAPSSESVNGYIWLKRSFSTFYYHRLFKYIEPT